MDLFVIPKKLPELFELERIAQTLPPQGSVSIIDHVEYRNAKFPLYSFSFGNPSPETPVFALFGGVHGLERIGTQVLVSYLKTVCTLLTWDDTIQDILSRVRLVFMPLVNPVGMMLRQRSNARGVDLMRNAPIDADSKPRFPLLGGHRISRHLPWYRGDGSAMETEARALCKLVQETVFPAKFAITLDIHSGFGTVDRLWFPYARSRAPFANLAHMSALTTLLDQTYPNHVYHVEPQSRSYTTHGDLWDYLYDIQPKHDPKVFLPMALELGSWLWVKKNPKQLFSAIGVFNPLIPHRYQRILRRHIVLLDFLLRAAASSARWASLSPSSVEHHEQQGLQRWYASPKSLVSTTQTPKNDK